MTVVRHTQSCVSGILRRAVRKCLVAMRLRVSVNKKQMLSVVSAGATAGVMVGGVSPTSQATPSPPSATSHHQHHRTMNHQHHHHHHRLRSSNATNTSVVSSSGSSGSSSLPIKDPLSAGGTTTAGRHQYGQRDGAGYHAPVCLDGEAVNLPPSIALPDGEDHPYATRMLHLRNYEQESEIYQKCTRPPPNRTVNDSESPPPYRCSSAGLLSTSSSSNSSTPFAGNNHPPSSTHHFGDNNTVTMTTCHQPAPSQFPVIRCHSLTSSSSSSSSSCSSSTAKRPTLLSNSSSSSSCSSTAADTPGNTDFLQKTVKILTGSKRVPPTQGQCISGGGSTSANVVGVMVPTNRTAPRRDNNSSGSASGSSSPTNRHSRPPV